MGHDNPVSIPLELFRHEIVHRLDDLAFPATLLFLNKEFSALARTTSCEPFFEVIYEACKEGYLDYLKFLYPGSTRPPFPLCAEKAAIGGRVDVLEWLFESLPLPEPGSLELQSIFDVALYSPIIEPNSEEPHPKIGCEATLRFLLKRGLLPIQPSPFAITTLNLHPNVLSVLNKVFREQTELASGSLQDNKSRFLDNLQVELKKAPMSPGARTWSVLDYSLPEVFDLAWPLVSDTETLHYIYSVLQNRRWSILKWFLHQNRIRRFILFDHLLSNITSSLTDQARHNLTPSSPTISRYRTDCVNWLLKYSYLQVQALDLSPLITDKNFSTLRQVFDLIRSQNVIPTSAMNSSLAKGDLEVFQWLAKNDFLRTVLSRGLVEQLVLLAKHDILDYIFVTALPEVVDEGWCSLFLIFRCSRLFKQYVPSRFTRFRPASDLDHWECFSFLEAYSSIRDQIDLMKYAIECEFITVPETFSLTWVETMPLQFASFLIKTNRFKWRPEYGQCEQNCTLVFELYRDQVISLSTMDLIHAFNLMPKSPQLIDDLLQDTRYDFPIEVIRKLAENPSFYDAVISWVKRTSQPPIELCLFICSAAISDEFLSLLEARLCFSPLEAYKNLNSDDRNRFHEALLKTSPFFSQSMLERIKKLQLPLDKAAYCRLAIIAGDLDLYKSHAVTYTPDEEDVLTAVTYLRLEIVTYILDTASPGLKICYLKTIIRGLSDTDTLNILYETFLEQICVTYWFFYFMESEKVSFRIDDLRVDEKHWFDATKCLNVVDLLRDKNAFSAQTDLLMALSDEEKHFATHKFPSIAINSDSLTPIIDPPEIEPFPLKLQVVSLEEFDFLQKSRPKVRAFAEDDGLEVFDMSTSGFQQTSPIPTEFTFGEAPSFASVTFNPLRPPFTTYSADQFTPTKFTPVSTPAAPPIFSNSYASSPLDVSNSSGLVSTSLGNSYDPYSSNSSLSLSPAPSQPISSSNTSNASDSSVPSFASFPAFTPPTFGSSKPPTFASSASSHAFTSSPSIAAKSASFSSSTSTPTLPTFPTLFASTAPTAAYPSCSSSTTALLTPLTSSTTHSSPTFPTFPTTFAFANPSQPTTPSSTILTSQTSSTQSTNTGSASTFTS